jgi:glutamine cyclotransferase
MKNIVLSALIVLFFLFIFSCKSDDNNENKNKTVNNDSVKNIDNNNPLFLKVYKKDTGNKIGDIIKISVDGSKLEPYDSVFLFINKQKINFLTNKQKDFEWDSKSAKTGTNIIEIELNRTEKKYSKQENLILQSDMIPEEYTFKVKRTYPHDSKSYTQGLFYFEGFLYEATGLEGESTVRKVKPETGEVIRSFAIPNDVFGEGIVKFEGRIIQLSWNSGRGFVYDFNTFKLIEEFNYTGEGWGICTDNRFLYMSNGSNRIKLLETQSYSEINTIEVYDDKGPVKYLNELEFINGFIYANIYQYDRIVKIDPSTGKVMANINLKGLLPMNDFSSKTDVLNGIAYDESKNRIFVTGKNWPKLFEVEFIKK